MTKVMCFLMPQMDRSLFEVALESSDCLSLSTGQSGGFPTCCFALYRGRAVSPTPDYSVAETPSYSILDGKGCHGSARPRIAEDRIAGDHKPCKKRAGIFDNDEKLLKHGEYERLAQATGSDEGNFEESVRAYRLKNGHLVGVPAAVF